MTVKTPELLVIESSTNTGCGTGAACSVPQNGHPAACGCQSDATTITLDRMAIKPIQAISQNQGSRWRSVRSGVMFAIACIASPCCTPLIVPAVLVLLGGTPLAAWIGHNLGAVYGALTALSMISLVLALRWVTKDHLQRMKPDARKHQSFQPISHIE